MRQSMETLTVRTRRTGLVEITPEVARVLAASRIPDGLVTVYCRHTSASLVIQENADPDVQRDLQAFFRRLVPEGDPLFIHTTEPRRYARTRESSADADVAFYSRFRRTHAARNVARDLSFRTSHPAAYARGRGAHSGSVISIKNSVWN